MRRTRTIGWLASLVAAGCSVSHDVDAPPDLEVDEPLTAAVSFKLSPKCQAQVKASFDGIPDDLECVGLYSDIKTKKVAPDVQSFVPAVPLWSDGADKSRWIRLPPDTKIDNSDPKAWKFPVGTRFFKEFSYPETGPIETRLFLKERDGFWRATAYIWNEDHSSALRDDAGKDVDGPAAGKHHVPSSRECEACHGSREHATLGFEEVSLGTEGAEGLTLATLVEKDLLTDMPQSLELKVGDDGSGKSEEIVRWLHINCGMSCHNDDENSEAYSTGLRLKLDPSQLDGRPTNEFSAIKSTVGVMAHTVQWADQLRIVAGDPENSLLYKLVSSRGGGKNRQMPPIASLRTDPEHVQMIYDWIKGMKPSESMPETAQPD
jgi:hypothetical protein